MGNGACVAVKATAEDIDHAVLARKEVQALVNAAKKCGKDRGAISTIALARIAEKHSLRAEEVNNILFDIWRCAA